MGLPCLYQSELKWKGQPYPLSEKRNCGSLMEPNVGARRTTNTWESFKQSLNTFEEHIAAPNLSQPAPDEHLNDLQKQGFSAIQEGNKYRPYNVDLWNKLALTSSPPTLRLTIRPQGIVSTGSQPFISWSIKKRVPYLPQMTLCFLKCTLTQQPVYTMSTESVKVCLLPSALTYYKKPLTGQNEAVYTITSNLPPLASHHNL